MAPPRISGQVARRGERRVRARRHLRRRSGDDDLHVRDDGPAEGRAACAPGAARASAGRADAARVPAAAGRPALDAGRLGLGRRPPQRALAGPPFRRAGGRAQVRQVRSGGGLAADGGHGVRNTFVPPTALRMLRDRRQSRADASPSPCARSARAARRSAPRPSPGAARRSGSPSTSSTARPSAISFSPPARRSASTRPAPSASRFRATGSASSARTARAASRTNSARSRVHAARPCDVPVLLEQARRDARRNSSATG